MLFVTKRCSAALLCLALLGINALAQKADCRPPKLTLDGHWKDDLNRQEVIIVTIPSYMTATYAKENKACRDPDKDGKPVTFQTDFEGNFTNGSTVEGFIYWCDTFTKDGKTYTTGVAHGPIFLKVGKDYKTLSGNFTGRNGNESISFTNITLEKEFRLVIVRTKAGARIYQDTSTDSRVRYTPAANTKVIIEHVAAYGAAGDPTWYAVSNGTTGPAGPNQGYIPANMVTCNTPKNDP